MGFFICRTHVKLFTFKDKKDKMYYINQLVLIDCIIIIGVYITFETNFFKKEIRDNFEITEMMKRAWAAQMEVLQVVAEICDKNNLQYFADWGTLLGAVRHKGFIPWDDDIDICLKREDYNQLINILPSQLPYGFVVAGMYASSERLRMAAYVPQLRVIADETLWNFNDYMKYFHGFPYQRVGIDIFPLDYIHKEDELAQLQKLIIQQGIIILRDWDTIEKSGQLTTALKNYGNLCGIQIEIKENIKNYLWKLIDNVTSLYHKDEAEYMTNYSMWLNIDNYKFKKEWYDKTVMLPFENIKIAAPMMYHEVLTAQFGDYMIPTQGATKHGYPFYGNMENELKKQIKATGFKGSIDEFCRAVSSGELSVLKKLQTDVILITQFEVLYNQLLLIYLI